MVLFLVLAGAAEGVGLLALLPLLEVAVGGGEAAGGSAAGRVASLLLAELGIPGTVGPLLALIVAALVVKAVLRWLAMRQVGYGVAAVAKDLRLRLLGALFSARWAHFVDESAGSLSNALGLEAFRASLAYRQACAVLALLLQLVVYLVVVLLVSPWVAAGALLVAAALMALLGGFVRMSRRAGEERTASADALVRGLVDVLPTMKAVKAMGREEAWLPRVAADAAGLETAERRQVLATETLRSFQEPLVAGVVAGGLYAGMVWGGRPFSELLLLVLLLYRILGRAHQLQTEYQGMAETEAAYRALEGATRRAVAAAEPPRSRTGPSAVAAERGPEGSDAAPPPAIGIRELSFAYGGTRVLEDVTIDIPTGALVLLVGRSGAGKTTLADLVAGLQEPTAGEIRVDGVPLASLDRARWRRRLGYVPQDAPLLHDTVAANVALGTGGVTRDDVWRALEQAGAAAFVRALPEGADSLVGERGARLSGGQRQRIALARALVGRPSLLILDEATTGIDPAAEQEIAETIARLRGRVTILAVAHRTRLEPLADRVYRIEHGRVAALDPPPAHAPSVRTSR